MVNTYSSSVDILLITWVCKDFVSCVRTPTRTLEFKFQRKEHCSRLESNPGLLRTKRLTYQCARLPRFLSFIIEACYAQVLLKLLRCFLGLAYLIFAMNFELQILHFPNYIKQDWLRPVSRLL